MPEEIIKDLQERLQKVENELALYKEHQHLGADGSSEFLGETNFVGKSLTLAGGIARNGRINAPFSIIDKSIGDVLQPDVSSRVVGLGMQVTGKYTDAEQINMLLGANKNIPASEFGTQRDYIDWSLTAEARIRIANSPQSSAAFSGPSVLGPLGFILAERTPQIESTGSLTLGGSTMVDSTANFPVDSLIGCLLNIQTEDGTIYESYKVLANTSNVITVGHYKADGSAELAAWTIPSGSYNYFLVTPMLLGGSNIPYDRVYVGQDIRLGYGSSAGSQPRYIKWGNGSPEGVVTANIGSMYLRFDGSTTTTLYIKTANNGSATGWTAK